jgi:hypothetical protein
VGLVGIYSSDKFISPAIFVKEARKEPFSSLRQLVRQKRKKEDKKKCGKANTFFHSWLY